MAIVKANYVRRGTGQRARVKATIRYMMHRPGNEQRRATRTLFGSDGVLSRQQAYRMIDEVRKGTRFFRIVLSPDPRREDNLRDLDLWGLTAAAMQQLEERLQKEIQWIAVEHDDHSPNRHIHALVLIEGRLSCEDLLALRRAVTALAQFQRQERDFARASLLQQDREQSAQISAFPAFVPPSLAPASWEPQAKPLVDVFTCFSCGMLQGASWAAAFRCSACGAKLGNAGRTPGRTEAQWG